MISLTKNYKLLLAIQIIVLRNEVITSEEVKNNLSKNCNQLLTEFALSSSNFTYCSIQYARPIKLCESCVDHYIGVVKFHKGILQDTSEKGKSCKDELLNLDKLEIIETSFKFVVDMWNTGQCDGCFEHLKDDSINAKLNSGTKKFLEAYNDCEGCIKKHELNGTYDTAVCKNCSENYEKMNIVYEHLRKDLGDGNICMDVVDMMNITRFFWSQELDCKVKTHKIPYILIILSSIVALIPVIFYLSARIFSKETETEPMPQRRLLTESENRSKRFGQMFMKES